MALKGAAIALALGLWFAPDARAQPLAAESPRMGAVRLKLGSYNPRPNIDSEPGLTPGEDGKLPYDRTFGRSGMLLFEIAYEHYLWQGVGAFGAGLSAGYAEKYGKATVAGDLTQTTIEPTALQVFPLRLHALYNFDYLALQWRIPLVPYLKGGIAYVPWRITKGGAVERVELPDPDGGDPEVWPGAGGKWGLSGAAGLAFLLDVLEPRLARGLDFDVGINHSYFFAEYDVLRTDVLFGGGGLNLSSRQWMFGLTLEF
jgi:hypothetical protein